MFQLLFAVTSSRERNSIFFLQIFSYRLSLIAHGWRIKAP